VGLYCTYDVRLVCVYSIAESINAGLDLEMPGTNKFRSPYYMTWSVNARKITVETIKKRARKVLELVQKCAKGAPEVCVSHIYNCMALITQADHRWGWRGAH
jgi:hypothetical protein